MVLLQQLGRSIGSYGSISACTLVDHAMTVRNERLRRSITSGALLSGSWGLSKNSAACMHDT